MRIRRTTTLPALSALRCLHAAVVRRRRSIAVLWLLVTFTATFSQTATMQEYQVKAALIYNFSQFIEWPANSFSEANSPLTICVMGDDPFGDSLLALQKRKYQTRPIVINYPKTVAEARSCRILYVDDPGKTVLGRDVAKSLGDAPVLTLSSSEDALNSGICIGFLPQDGKIRWTLNLEAARKAHLRISAKLIEIAVAVFGEASR
jgi:hypothetical protein